MDNRPVVHKDDVLAGLAVYFDKESVQHHRRDMSK